MLDYVIILLMGLLGYEGAGWWVILLGAIALTFDLWLQLYEMLRSGQPVRLDWQSVAYVTASFATQRHRMQCVVSSRIFWISWNEVTAKGGAQTRFSSARASGCRQRVPLPMRSATN
jgi:hypothetical protein